MNEVDNNSQDDKVEYNKNLLEIPEWIPILQKMIEEIEQKRNKKIIEENKKEEPTANATMSL